MGFLDAPAIGQVTADKRYPAGGQTASMLMGKLDANRESTSVFVAGDSTGDESNVQGRWVLLMAQWFAARYPAISVFYHQWNIGTPTDLSQPGSWDPVGTGKSVQVSTGTGTGNAGGPFELHIWSGSASGSAPSYDLNGSRWQTMAIPLSPAPDLAIVNHGHNMSGSSAAQARYNVLKLTRAIQDLWPQAGIMITAQNPMISGYGDYALDLLRARAMINLAATEGYGLINILQLFLNNPTYATDWISSTDGLGLHPNSAGSVVWAAEVTRQLATTTFTVPRAPQHKRNRVFLPASAFTPVPTTDPIITGMTAQPTLGLVAGSAQMLAFPASQASCAIADVELPSHWTQFDAYLLWCVASTTGKTASTVVSWRLLRQQIMLGRTYPLDIGFQALGSWVDPGVQSRNPSNGSAYQTVSSIIAQQSTLADRVQAVRLQRSGNNGTDNIAETAYVRGVLFTQAT